LTVVSASTPEPYGWRHRTKTLRDWWQAREQWQRWACVIALGIVLVLAWERWQRWELTGKQAQQKTWERDGVIRLDENGDGIIDQEKRPGKVPGEFIIRKDANFDGTFDLRYRQLTNGLATGLEQIKESAPRQ
jgi:hypothetical protein